MGPPRPPLRLVPAVAHGPAARAPMGPAIELATLGVGVVLAVSLMARLPPWPRALGSFQALFALGFGFFALAALRTARYAAVPRAGLLVFAVALAARAALLPVPPSLSHDIARYVWEGRVLVHGGDPYRQSPADTALATLRDGEVWPRVNHPELSTIYPPLAEAGFALMARVAPGIPPMKLWIVLHDLALVGVLMAWSLKRTGSAASALVYAWNPLVLVEYAGSGHNDPTGMLWLALALLLAESRPTLSAVALAAGTLIKLAPLAALPFLLPRWSWRARLIGLGAIAAGLGWFWTLTRSRYSGLIAYWGTWRNNELVFHYLERWTGRFEAARTLGLAIVAVVLVIALVRRRPPERGARDVLRAAALTSPVLHPWYLGWVLVFEPLAPSAPWLLLSLTAILNYGVFGAPREGADFHLPLLWRWVEYGLPALLAVVLAVRARISGRRTGQVRGG